MLDPVPHYCIIDISINCLVHQGSMPLDYQATGFGGWGQLPVCFTA